MANKKTPGTLEESPAQHIRNAMQTLSLCRELQPANSTAVVIPNDEYEGLYARLARAVCMLENLAYPFRSYRTHGKSSECPDVIAGNATRCPGHIIP